MSESKFDQPTVLNATQLVFPIGVSALMPARDDIPKKFYEFQGTKWNEFINEWFYYGNPFAKWNLYTRPDIDPKIAINHITAIMRSYEPKHEDKIASCAYLLSRWFPKIEEIDQTP